MPFLLQLLLLLLPLSKRIFSLTSRRGSRDASLFMVLKDPKQWDSWHCSTVAEARAQNVFEVLNPSFKPAATEQGLFEAKQKYIYAVSERVLQTD